MKIQLPETFTASMKDLLGDEYQAYLDSFEEPRIYGLRVNTLKWTPEQCRQVYGDFQQVPWIANGLLYPEERRMAKDPYYYAGSRWKKHRAGREINGQGRSDRQ